MRKENTLSAKRVSGETLKIALISFFATSVLLLIFFAMAGINPFGDRSLLYRDGEIQMLDLFCWYKNVLTGRSSVDYTLAKSLGGSNFSVFTYYLASPFSLLIVFFDKSQTPLFMNITFMLKSALAAAFMAVYLTKRFTPGSKAKCFVTTVLSISYALSPFFVTQSSNIMWLDGAYLLPLILLGSGKIAHGKKSLLFIITAALALCFNWYSGIIDLMFSCFWFLFELCMNNVSEDSKKGTRLKSALMSILRFGISCICSLLIASAILIPTLLKLSERTHGKGGLSMLLDFSFMGSIPDTVLNYSFGAISLEGHASLFAGSFVLIGICLLFIASAKPLKEKIIYGILLLFTILMFVWQPLVALFSMLRTVESFWYRYSYLGIFALIIIAAAFYLDEKEPKVKAWMPPVIAGIFSIIVIALFYISPARLEDRIFAVAFADITLSAPDYNIVPVVAKVIFPIVISALMCVLILSRKEKETVKRIFSAVLAIAVASELVLGQVILAHDYSTPGSNALANYMGNEEKLLSSIDDPSFYRVVQTSYHSIHLSMLPASYNEPMAFGFNSVTSFVSDPDEKTITFMDRSGYKSHSETITVTTSENLACDSLLGVKYVLIPSGDADTAGLTKTTGIDNFKDVYQNPNAFPAAFVYEGTGDFDSNGTCPALYLNDMYKKLTGISEDLFVQASIKEVALDGSYSFTVDLGENYDPDKYILYADFVTDTEDGAKLMVNGEKITEYSRFLAPSFVRIKSDSKDVHVSLEFTEASHKVTEAHFYLLDLEVLAKASSIAQSKKVSDLALKDGYGKFTVENAKSGESLFVSVPVENGWTVTLNGRETACNRIGGVLMSIPLEDGKNEIEMVYKLPYKTPGIVATVIGIVLLAGMVVIENKKLSDSK